MSENITNKKILEFLRELRESNGTISEIYLKGSCFRLFRILKVIFPQANPCYSDRDGHWVTEIDGFYYDIQGRLSEKHVRDMEYEHCTDNITLTSASVHTHSNQLSTWYSKYEEI